MASWCVSEITGTGQCNVPEALGLVVETSVGSAHSCAVQAEGELVCFGDNTHGQCDVPEDLGPVKVFSAGAAHTCALSARTGHLECFGDNSEGQCNVPRDLGTVVAVSAGAGHTCAVCASGEVICFGSNDCGQRDVWRAEVFLGTGRPEE